MKEKKVTDSEMATEQPSENDKVVENVLDQPVEEGDIGKKNAADYDVENNPNPERDLSNIEEDDKKNDPFTELIAERDNLKDQLLRAMADTENMRRRNEREAANVRKYGHTSFARELVGAIDNLSRAVESAENESDVIDENVKSLITGIHLSWTELQSVLEKHGIKRIEPLKERFDYNFHQAMFEVPTKDQPSGIVLEVVQHGYVLHDRLLRPAMVGVSKAEEAVDSQEDVSSAKK